MNCTDCTRVLDDYVDGELTTATTHTVETHLHACASCRAQLNALRALLATARTLPNEFPPPRDLWSDVHREIPNRTGSAVGKPPRHGGAVSQPPITIARPARLGPSLLHWLAPFAVAAMVVVLAPVSEKNISRRIAPAWSVAAVAGAPRIGTHAVRDEAKFRVGQWLETDADSRAKVAVGTIGEVNLEPNSRLRLVGMAATNHRLELARGEMSAFIWAPPRLFFVNTPSATAVDLGCAYTLKVDPEGNGELHVSTGYVALEDGDRESIIPAGMMCFTRRGSGPGTPFAVDAPEAMRIALSRFDFDRGAAGSALVEVLAQARTEDAVTLWHLLARTDSTQRAAVFDLLAKFAPPPPGVSREGILAGSAPMRRAWAEELGLNRL
jgi:hypothetical protein